MKRAAICVLAAGISTCLALGAQAETFTATEQGFGGEVTVSLSLEDGVLTDVQVTGDNETEGVGQRAVESMPKAMLEANSIEVDMVAGATISSTAILNAAKAALEESGVSLEAAEVSVSTMVPGTYTATVKGFHDGMTVETEVSEDAIVSVKVVDHQETDGVGSFAIEALEEEIPAYQSLADAVSGATLTSNGIFAAVSDCLTQAGANSALLGRFMAQEIPA